MLDEFLEILNEYSKKEEPFTVATVIRTEGAASAEPGSKAIFDAEGNRITGWIGGGCAESTVSQESLICIANGETKIVFLDLDDEVLGAGMPCGGSMEIYIEPQYPAPEMMIIGHGRIAETLAKFGSILKFKVIVNDPMATEANFPTANKRVNVDFDKMELSSNSYVIVATQHKGDHFSLKQALSSKSPYVALIASKKRTKLTFQYLLDTGVTKDDIERIRAPAGLDLGSATPEEIALSIMSEIIAIKRGGTGQSLKEIKGVNLMELSQESS